jgi:hypothetical protein
MKPLRLETCAELCQRAAIEERRERRRLNRIWHHDSRHRTITYRPLQYEIDLDRCTTSAAVLDWICQIANKTWATDTVLAALVRQLNALLEPQANLCSFGVECGDRFRNRIAARLNRGAGGGGGHKSSRRADAAHNPIAPRYFGGRGR